MREFLSRLGFNFFPPARGGRRYDFIEDGTWSEFGGFRLSSRVPTLTRPLNGNPVSEPPTSGARRSTTPLNRLPRKDPCPLRHSDAQVSIG